jgi:hypothetical protein
MSIEHEEGFLELAFEDVAKGKHRLGYRPGHEQATAASEASEAGPKHQDANEMHYLTRTNWICWGLHLSSHACCTASDVSPWLCLCCVRDARPRSGASWSSA